MLITNGKITRKIDAKRLAEYASKGYTEVKETVKPQPKSKGSAKN